MYSTASSHYHSLSTTMLLVQKPSLFILFFYIQILICGCEEGDAFQFIPLQQRQNPSLCFLPQRDHYFLQNHDASLNKRSTSSSKTLDITTRLHFAMNNQRKDDEKGTNEHTETTITTPKTYLLVVNRDDLLVSQEVARLLLKTRDTTSTTIVYVACPSVYTTDTRVWMERLQQDLVESEPATTGSFAMKLLECDLGTDVQTSKAQAVTLCQQIKKEGTNRIDGVVYNYHGSRAGRFAQVTQTDNNSTVLDIVEYKILGMAILLDELLQQRHNLLSNGARVMVAGSEVARGFPERNFPVPSFNTVPQDVESYRSILSGTSSAIDTSNGNEVYAYAEAMQAMYIGAMARKYNNVYFLSYSPGFTQDSLNPAFAIYSGVRNRIFFFLLRRIHPYMIKSEEAVDYKDSAKMVYTFLTEDGCEYPNGSLVGCAKGFSGEVCNQFTLEDGRFLGDTKKQDLTFDAVQSTFL